MKKEEIKAEIAKEKSFKYKVKVTNLEDRGQNLQFFLENKYYDIPDGEEVVLKKEVIDHLNNIFMTETKLISNGDDIEKTNLKRNRVLCSIIEKIED